jgi:D-alanine-D-alanine ligase
LALHKHKAKEVLRARGVPTPEAAFVTQKGQIVALPFPLIVKPAREDASVGIYSESVVSDEAALQARIAHVLDQYRQPALVERYIEGREIYVSLLGRVGASPEVLPFFEIDFSGLPADRPRIVSFEGKWVEDSVEYAGTKPVRCDLEPAVAARVAAAAQGAWDALELRDYGRVDIRLAADGTPYVIDINPNCDLSHEAGGFARAARAAGLTYDDVVARLLELALARQPHAQAKIPRTHGRPSRTAAGAFQRPRALDS